MVVYVEILVGGVDFLYAQSLQRLNELLENEVHAFLDGSRIVSMSVSKCALEVVEDWQNGSNGLFAAVQYEFSLLFQRAFLIVFKLGHCAQQLVFQLGYLVQRGVEWVFRFFLLSLFRSLLLQSFLCVFSLLGLRFCSLSLVFLFLAFAFDIDVFLFVHSFSF